MGYRVGALSLLHGLTAASLVLRFASVFPTPTPPVSRRLQWIMTTCAVASCIASLTPLLAQGTSSVNGGLSVRYGSLYRAFAAYLVLSLAGSIALLSSKLRLLTGVERLQVQFVLLGIGVAESVGRLQILLSPSCSARHT